MENLLTELINATLCQRALYEEVAQGATQKDWERCFELALRQQVLAMTFPTMAALPKELRPDFTLWSRWMAYSKGTAEQARHKREVVKKIGSWLAEEGLSTIVIKGFSLAALYPRPELRECGDVDIYSGPDYEAVNACLARHGLQLGRPDGHHIHITVDGVSLEHHFALHNVRVQHGKGMEGPVETLQRLATIDRKATLLPGIDFPNPAFMALFTAWHAHKHFLAEKIELRHVVDWALALRQLSDEDATVVYEAKEGTSWGRFADTLTAIALHRLHLPEEWFPQQELESVAVINPNLEQRTWNDIIGTPHTPHGCTKMVRRINIARRMLQNRWKFDTYADMSAERFLWKEFVGYMKNRKA